MRPDPFLLAMAAAAGFALVAPASGNAAAALDSVMTVGVAILFFLHGAALAPSAIVKGMGHWRLHAFILCLTYVLFPAAAWFTAQMMISVLPQELRLGIIYLGVLPSAVSSSVAFTVLAKGNVPVAVCHSAGSNIVGMVFTPLLVILLFGAQTQAPADLSHLISDVMLQLLLPYILGQIAHRWWGAFLACHPRWLSNYDQTIIVGIVFAAFSRSTALGIWDGLRVTDLVLTAGVCTALLAFIAASAALGARWLGFPREDAIAALFCGSKKSLASGLPLAQILFATNPNLGLLALPIILYNQIQILIGAVLARWLVREKAAPIGEKRLTFSWCRRERERLGMSKNS